MKNFKESLWIFFIKITGKLQEKNYWNYFRRKTKIKIKNFPFIWQFSTFVNFSLKNFPEFSWAIFLLPVLINFRPLTFCPFTEHNEKRFFLPVSRTTMRKFSSCTFLFRTKNNELSLKLFPAKVLITRFEGKLFYVHERVEKFSKKKKNWKRVSE